MTNMPTGDVCSRKRIIAVARLSIMKKYDYGHVEEIEVYRENQNLYKFREGLIYKEQMNRNRLMRADELHKFSDSTLDDVCQNRRDLPRDIPLDSVVVLRYEKRSKSENKGKVPTEMELVLEQTQQGTSYEVSAYDMLGLAKESLLDAILFINECSQSTDLDLSSRHNKVPDYAESLVKKQMRVAWLFREAVIKHEGINCEADEGDDGRKETNNNDDEWNNEEGIAYKNNKLSARVEDYIIATGIYMPHTAGRCQAKGFRKKEQSSSSQSMVLPRPATIVPFRRIHVPKKPKACEPNKKDMTYEEKQKLSSNRQNLPLDNLDGVTDSVDIEMLWELDRYVTNYRKNLIVFVPDAPNDKRAYEQGLAPTPLNQGENRGDNASSSSSLSSDSSLSDSDNDNSSEERSPRVIMTWTLQEMIGNTDEAETKFQLGKSITSLLNLPMFVVAFSTRLGMVFQEALRVMKYAVGKSGADFKREMSRNSVVVCQLIHHKGQPDPLKENDLNKAIRETAQEVLSAIFSREDTIGIRSAIIKQGFNNLKQAQTTSKNNTRTYRTSNLRRSLTNETNYSETLPTSRLSADVSGPWGQEIRCWDLADVVRLVDISWMEVDGVGSAERLRRCGVEDDGGGNDRCGLEMMVMSTPTQCYCGIDLGSDEYAYSVLVMVPWDRMGTPTQCVNMFVWYILEEEEEEKEESEKKGSKEASEMRSNSKSPCYAASDNEVESDLESTSRSEPKNGNGGNNRCSYKAFLACNPRDYDGKGGAVALTRWIEKMESVIENSRCPENQKVKYAASSFINKALTWWNTQVQARGSEAALGMTWVEFKALLVEEFCPRYTDQFHELAKLVPHLVTPESKRIGMYISGLAPQIRGMLRATQPTMKQSVILKAGILTDKAVRCGTLSRSREKRKEAEETSKQGGSWKDNKKAKVGKGFVVTAPTRNENVGSYSKCAKCSAYYPEGGPCRLCFNCQKPSHFARDCWAPVKQVASVSDVRMGNNQRVCYECGSSEHLRNTFPKLNRAPSQERNRLALKGNRNTPNNGNQARERAFSVNAVDALQDPNIVTGTFSLNDHFATILFDSGADFSFISTKFAPLLDVKPSIVSHGYVIEVANGKKEEVDRIIRDCKLELENSLFTIDLIPLGHGSFDLVVGGEILRVQGEHTLGCTKTLMSTKAEEPELGDIPIVRDFIDVFPEDFRDYHRNDKLSSA
ncbi:putative reverse transcriptase domain-containing protein [Tanacetum coccineum]